MVATHAAPVAYRAFLSYSHADERQAARLHQRLEGWHIPAKLLTADEDAGAPNERPFSPIFRDREELSAGDDLSAQVQAALQCSEALIVLCSPAAKASQWVGREIEMFRALHPDRPVLAAIIAGEPEDCFPDALTARGNEPIAADLRKDKDGARLGLLKLAAGLTGLPLAALVQRDAQRQLRRVMAITGMAVAGMLIMALLTILAARARNEAQAQRQQAEGLVEYMLTDLRDRLKGVGRLDVMTAVNERAMDYYTRQGALDTLPLGSLERRARILHAMGEDDEKRGDLDLALQKFREAHRTTAGILAQRPDNADAIFAHAQSEYWVGYIEYRRENYAAAHKRFDAYRMLADRLVKVAPQDSRSFQEVSYAEGNLCALAMEPPVQVERALVSCKDALQGMQKVNAMKPADKAVTLAVANRHAWYADALLAAGKAGDALAEREEEGRLIDTLLTQVPMDRDVQYRKAMYHISMVNIFRVINRSQLADDHRKKGISLLEILQSLDPNNQEFQSRLRNIKSMKGDKNG